MELGRSTYFLFDAVGALHTPSHSATVLWLHDLVFVNANARKRPRSSYRKFARDLVGGL